MNWNIKSSSIFRADYRSLPKSIQIQIPDTLRSLADNPFADFLGTHQLKDRLSGYYACSIDGAYRIIMRISREKREITLLDVGNHDIYERYSN